MTLIIISFLIITSYVGVMIYRKGIPYSISDTYYSLEHKVWFGFSMIATALLLMPSILDRTPENFQFLAFLMCAGICFVGVAPNFKAGIDRPVHIVSTVISAVCSQLWLALVITPYSLLVWLVWLAYEVIMVKKVWNGHFINSFILTKPLFWAEAIAFLSVYIGLIFQ